MQTLKAFLTDLAKLRLPVTATAIAALIAELIPGVNVSGTVIAGVLVAVGGLAYLVLGLIPAPAPVKRAPRRRRKAPAAK